MNNQQKIRPIVLAIFRQDHRILVTETFLNRWLPLSFFDAASAPPLYPTWLLQLLRETSS